MLAIVKSYFGKLVWLQCNPHAVRLLSFVSIPQYVPRPFAGVSMYDMSLPRVKRLRVVGCGLEGKLIRQLSLSVDCYFEPQSNWGACHKMMLCVARRIASKQMAALRDEVAKEAEDFYALGQFAAAILPLQLAVDLGHLPSRALMAHILLRGREGVAQDRNIAFELVEEGARVGCHHCQGVLAECYWFGYGCQKDEARSLELARESSGNRSKYGQYKLGNMYCLGNRGVAKDYAQALALYQLAIEQNFDLAQYNLGVMYYYGVGFAQDCAEALRLFLLAAAQGNPGALYCVAQCHENGQGGVPKNKVEAIRWYRRAQAAGYLKAAAKLQELSA